MTWSCTIQLLAPALVLFFCNMQNCVNNNRLLMMPQLVRAQSAYKGLPISTFHHIHTNTWSHMYTQLHTHTFIPPTPTHTTKTRINGDGLTVKRQKKWQISMRKRWVFSFCIKEESEEDCLTERGREFQMPGPMYWKEVSPTIPLPTLGPPEMWGHRAEGREDGGTHGLHSWTWLSYYNFST